LRSSKRKAVQALSDLAAAGLDGFEEWALVDPFRGGQAGEWAISSALSADPAFALVLIFSAESVEARLFFGGLPVAMTAFFRRLDADRVDFAAFAAGVLPDVEGVAKLQRARRERLRTELSRTVPRGVRPARREES